MAAKPTKPRKFKQARNDAKSAAKKTFSGNAQARLKDPKLKLSADDAKALNDVKMEAKGNYITDAQGNKINVSPTETAKERIARERKAAMNKFRERVATEDGVAEKPEPKKAAVKKTAAPAKKAAAPKKTVVKKPATTASLNTGSKELKTTEGKARYDKLVKEGVKPKSAMNKALFYEAKLPGQKAASAPAVKKAGATKAKSFKKITDASLTSQEDAYRQSKVDKLVKEGKLSGSKEIAIRSKGEVATTKTKAVVPRTQTATPIKGSDKVVTQGGKKGFFRKVGRKLLFVPLAVEAGSIIKGSTEKDFKEIQRLENELASATGKAPKYKNMGSNKNVGESLKADFSNIASQLSMGLVGKTRRERMDELNSKIDKAQVAKNKRIAAGRAAKPGISPAGSRSSSKINNTFAPKLGAAGAAGAAGGSGSAGAGSNGSSSGIAGGAYIVKSGDTLSAIAKRAGVKLEDIYATNKKFKTNPKYKGGNMIWSGTKVNIPTKK